MRRFLYLLLAAPLHALPEAPPAKFRAQTLDAKLGIGYGLSIADIDGDGKQDIVLVDAKETLWYKNPEWSKHRMTGALTKLDHVCVAACDIDHDKKAEVAIGAEWNPGDTKNSGAVFTLTAPGDRTGEWTAQEQHREPTVHRMYWVKEAAESFFLAVLPLHGCNNVNTEGDGIRFLGYQPQKEAGKQWPTFVISDQFHLAHNFDPVTWPGTPGESMLVACKEGVHLLRKAGDGWNPTRMTEKGSGEVRLGKLPDGKRMIATIEPFHGNEVAVNPEAADGLWSAKRVLLDDGLAEGHALATADFLGLGYDQIIAGWRKADKNQKVGIRLYIPTVEDGSMWKLHATVDDNTMACEDFKVADLNGDGKPDIIAAGRATKNLIVYWNERP
ncbi:VCBS repeat-containing protein [Luteolibacter sp. GHJ8]|uniref:VCBS repeat-containing protein n=1 Tax=Luteolibacter rhizosphaerae TaxID=2989719 RepID=A0ABT3G244_9BACT|nr:FG-GAP and VCBS repeat-containing protein [Luteolibacter rhizosphaerae]MCW1913644.1 VCBS repeat-containing protein [Luteolibacter rhizosphaerae]